MYSRGHSPREYIKLHEGYKSPEEVGHHIRWPEEVGHHFLSCDEWTVV